MTGASRPYSPHNTRPPAVFKLTMTDTEINDAIAEACGWTFDGRWWSHPTLPDNGGAEPMPPDFTADLNAMHEAEKVLFAPEFRKPNGRLITNLRTFQFTESLSEVVGNLPTNDYDVFRIAHATARQRAEAFLHTLGKWKD